MAERTAFTKKRKDLEENDLEVLAEDVKNIVRDAKHPLTFEQLVTASLKDIFYIHPGEKPTKRHNQNYMKRKKDVVIATIDYAENVMRVIEEQSGLYRLTPYRGKK